MANGRAAVRSEKVSAKGGIGVVRAWSGRPPTGADQAGVVLPAGLPGDGPAGCPPVGGRRMSCPVPAACSRGRGCVPGAAAPGRSGTRAWRASRGRPPDGCGHGRNRSRTYMDPSPRCPGRPVPGGPPAAAAPHDGHHRVPSKREVGDPREPPHASFASVSPHPGMLAFRWRFASVGGRPWSHPQRCTVPVPLSRLSHVCPGSLAPDQPTAVRGRRASPGHEGRIPSLMACCAARWTPARPRRRSPSCAGASGAGPRRAVPPRSARSRFSSSRPPCGSAPAPAAAAADTVGGMAPGAVDGDQRMAAGHRPPLQNLSARRRPSAGLRRRRRVPFLLQCQLPQPLRQGAPRRDGDIPSPGPWGLDRPSRHRGGAAAGAGAGPQGGRPVGDPPRERPHMKATVAGDGLASNGPRSRPLKPPFHPEVQHQWRW